MSAVKTNNNKFVFSRRTDRWTACNRNPIYCSWPRLGFTRLQLPTPTPTLTLNYRLRLLFPSAWELQFTCYVNAATTRRENRKEMGWSWGTGKPVWGNIWLKRCNLAEHGEKDTPNSTQVSYKWSGISGIFIAGNAWLATTTKMHWIENVWIYIASLTWLKHLISLPFDSTSATRHRRPPPCFTPSLLREWKTKFRHKDLLVCNLGWGWLGGGLEDKGNASSCYSCRRSTNKL